jgi:hypothetical protein
MLLTLCQSGTNTLPPYLSLAAFMNKADIDRQMMYYLLSSGSIKFYRNSQNLVVIPSTELAKVQGDDLGSIFSKAKDIIQKVANTKVGSNIKTGLQKLIPKAVSLATQKLAPKNQIVQVPVQNTYIPAQLQQYPPQSFLPAPAQSVIPAQVQQYPQIQPQSFLPPPAQPLAVDNNKLFIGLAIGAVTLIGVAIVLTRRQEPAAFFQVAPTKPLQ